MKRASSEPPPFSNRRRVFPNGVLVMRSRYESFWNLYLSTFSFVKLQQDDRELLVNEVVNKMNVHGKEFWKPLFEPVVSEQHADFMSSVFSSLMFVAVKSIANFLLDWPCLNTIFILEEMKRCCLFIISSNAVINVINGGSIADFMLLSGIDIRERSIAYDEDLRDRYLTPIRDYLESEALLLDGSLDKEHTVQERFRWIHIRLRLYTECTETKYCKLGACILNETLRFIEDLLVSLKNQYPEITPQHKNVEPRYDEDGEFKNVCYVRRIMGATCQNIILEWANIFYWHKFRFEKK